jgi:hypothetical protein
VRPGASAEAVGGTHAGALLVRVRARPVQGQANRAACRALARALDLPASAVELRAGGRGRRKRVRVSGDAETLRARIERLRAI